MKCFKGMLFLLFVASSFSLAFILSAMACGIPSEKSDESQEIALWTESEPHSMETKTAVVIEGTIQSINKKANILTVKTKEGKKVDLNLSADTKITIGTETKSSADMVQGMKIKSTYSKKGGKNVALTIEAEAKTK